MSAAVAMVAFLQGFLQGDNNMKFAFLLVSCLSSGLVWAADQEVFNCKAQIEEENLSYVVNKADGVYNGVLESGNGPMVEEVEYKEFTKEEALQDSFVLEMANGYLKLDWEKVSHVELFHWGNFYDDAAGALGFNFFDENGAVFAKGMIFGWAGPLKCDP